MLWLGGVAWRIRMLVSLFPYGICHIQVPSRKWISFSFSFHEPFNTIIFVTFNFRILAVFRGVFKILTGICHLLTEKCPFDLYFIMDRLWHVCIWSSYIAIVYLIFMFKSYEKYLLKDVWVNDKIYDKLWWIVYIG